MRANDRHAPRRVPVPINRPTFTPHVPSTHRDGIVGTLRESTLSVWRFDDDLPVQKILPSA
jgi:hypothetical protein